MIKAKELRIGNLLYYINEPELTHPDIITVESICHGGINVCVSYGDLGNEYYLKDLQPIPLTEEWLLKFGFVKKRDWYYLLPGNKKQFKNELSIYWNNHYNFAYFSINEENSQRQFGAENKYVHQLQNLYFALTAEELEIK